MAGEIPNSPHRGSRSFQTIVDAFLVGEGLPFAGILSAERMSRIFSKHGCQFGVHGVYTAAVTIWSFLSQVLRDGKEAACQSAVARVVGYCLSPSRYCDTDVRYRRLRVHSRFAHQKMGLA